MQSLHDASLKSIVQKSFSQLNLDWNDIEFAKRIYNCDISKYQYRLMQLGFHTCQNVIDIGAGFGQWTLALAKICKNVTAVELCPNRCEFINRILKELSIPNVKVISSSLPKLEEIPQGSYDGAFCYSTLMITPWRESLTRIKTLLSKDAIFYFNFNCLGWYIYLWETENNSNIDYDPKKVVFQALENAWRYKNKQTLLSGQMLIDKDEILQYLDSMGLTIIDKGKENSISVYPEFKQQNEQFLLGEYKNIEAVYEILAKN